MVVGAVALLGGLPSGGPEIVRVPLGLLAVLVAPGYALVTAGLPGNDQLGFVERIASGLALSLGLITIGALALDWLPIGLTPGAMRSSTVALTMVLLVVAAVRRSRIPLEHARVWGSRVRSAGEGRAARFTKAIIAMNVVVAGLAYAFTVGRAAPTPTEFYVLGSTGLLAEYPTIVAPGEPFTVRMGVRQSSDAAGQYTITARNEDMVLATRGVSVGPGATSETDWSLALDRVGPDQAVVFLLAASGQEVPIRTLRLWITVRSPST